jgi:hypothetical protein
MIRAFLKNLVWTLGILGLLCAMTAVGTGIIVLSMFIGETIGVAAGIGFMFACVVIVVAGCITWADR